MSKKIQSIQYRARGSKVLTPISSTIILSKPEGPKELLTTFAMAWVASTVTSQLNDRAIQAIYRHIPFCSRTSAPVIFCPPKTVRVGQFDRFGANTWRSENSQRVSAFRGASKMPAMTVKQTEKTCSKQYQSSDCWDFFWIARHSVASGSLRRAGCAKSSAGPGR